MFGTKLRLIEDWRNLCKFWSVRLSVIGTAISGALVAFPDFATQVWLVLPEDVKSAIPANKLVFIGIAISALSVIARSLKQKNLDGAK